MGKTLEGKGSPKSEDYLLASMQEYRPHKTQLGYQAYYDGSILRTMPLRFRVNIPFP